MIHYDSIPRTIVGRVFVAATAKGLCAVSLGRQAEKSFEAGLAKMSPGRAIERNRDLVGRHIAELEAYFAGERRRFGGPLDLSVVRSPFQHRVLLTLGGLPFGALTSYGELARRAGYPGAARAVGNAMAGNPVPIVIPCHRVVGAGGVLGGYSGGLALKKALLRHEGVPLTREALMTTRSRW